MYKVYYTMPDEGGLARAETFGSDEMGAALKRSQTGSSVCCYGLRERRACG